MNEKMDKYIVPTAEELNGLLPDWFIPEWRSRVMELNHQNVTNDSIVLFGDSITAMNGEGWASMLANDHVVNFGICSDRGNGFRKRIDQAIAGKPRIIVLEMGLNNFFDGESVSDVLNIWKDILKTIRSVSPETQIFGFEMTPVNNVDNPGQKVKSESLLIFNFELQKLAHEFEFELVKIFQALADSDGKIRNAVAKDSAHPNQLGYLVMADALGKAIFNKSDWSVDNNGYEISDGKLAFDGVLFSGTYNEVLYVSGEPFNGVFENVLYQAGVPYTGWQSNRDMRYENGQIVSNSYFSVGGKTFFAETNGKLIRSKFHDQHYFDKNGVMYKNIVFVVAGKTYIADTEGNSFPASGQLFYKDGEIFTGWVEDKYYMTGQMITSRTFEVDGQTYHADLNGNLSRSKFVDGRYYDKHGVLYRNIQFVVHDELYVADENGSARLSSGEVKVNGKFYKNGQLYNGWANSNTNFYINGMLVKSDFYDGNYFDSNGNLITDTIFIVHGLTYRADAEGKSQKLNEVFDNLLYKDGKPYTGWFNDKEQRYENGKLLRSQTFEVDGVKYKAGEDGVINWVDL